MNVFDSCLKVPAPVFQAIILAGIKQTKPLEGAFSTMLMRS